MVSPTCLQLPGLVCGHSSENNYSNTLWSERWLVRGQAAYSEHWFKSGPSLDWPEVPSICRFMSVTSDTSHRQLFSSWLLHTCFWCPHYCGFIGNLDLGQKCVRGVNFARSKGKVCVWGSSLFLPLPCFLLQGAPRRVNLRRDWRFTAEIKGGFCYDLGRRFWVNIPVLSISPLRSLTNKGASTGLYWEVLWAM